MEYKEVKLENGKLIETSSITIDQSKLTSDCWLIQFKGLQACKDCYLKNTDECGGGDTLKNMTNKVLTFNYTITYTIDKEVIKNNLISDGYEESDITDDVLQCEGENITRSWLDEAIEECQINSSEEYFSCEILND